MVYYIQIKCAVTETCHRGDITIRFMWETMQVQVLSSAPNKNKTNLGEKSKFVLFYLRDYFGIKVKR